MPPIGPDLVNLACAALYLLVLLRWAKAGRLVAILFFGHLGLVFLLNGVLFPPEFMSDQYRYLDYAIQARRLLLDQLDLAPLGPGFPFEDYAFWDALIRRDFPLLIGWLFALFPLPYIHSFHSLGLINIVILALTYFILARMGFMRGPARWVFLLYPSLSVYTALALKEAWILLALAPPIALFLRHKPIVAMGALLPLSIFRIQSFALLAPVMLAHATWFSRLPLRGKILMGALAGLLFWPLYGRVDLSTFNWAMRELHQNLPGDPPSVASFTELALRAFSKASLFLLRPLPWEASGFLQIFQSVENLLLVGLIIAVLILGFRRKWFDPGIHLLNGFLLAHVLAYAPLVENLGTLARYRYSFLAVYLLFLLSYWPPRAERPGENEDDARPKSISRPRSSGDPP